MNKKISKDHKQHGGNTCCPSPMGNLGFTTGGGFGHDVIIGLCGGACMYHPPLASRGSHPTTDGSNPGRTRHRASLYSHARVLSYPSISGGLPLPRGEPIYDKGLCFNVPAVSQEWAVGHHCGSPWVVMIITGGYRLQFASTPTRSSGVVYSPWKSQLVCCRRKSPHLFSVKQANDLCHPPRTL